MQKSELILKEIRKMKLEENIGLLERQRSANTDRLKDKEYHEELKTILEQILQSVNNNPAATQINSREFSLDDYIIFVEEKNREKYHDENKLLSDYYVQQKMIRVDQAEWNSEYMSSSSRDTIFNFDDFFNDQREYRAIIGAPFGIGKTALSKSKVSEYARKYKLSQSNWIPILVILRHGVNGIYHQYSLEDLLAFIYDHAENDNVFLILDGLDEYSGNVKDLLNNIQDYQRKYPKLKKIIATSRLESRPPLMLFDRHVRLLPFSKPQVDQFFNKYLNNNKYSYANLEKKGLQKSEITNPLFCWMIAYSDSENDQGTEFQKQWSSNLQKTLLYMSFIRKLLHGKFVGEAKKFNEDWNEHYGNEKVILRKIAAMKSIYRSKLSEEVLIEELKGDNSNSDNASDVVERLEPILSSYFHSTKEPLQGSLVEFLHRSFYEYLLAEYYIECMLERKSFRLNVGIPSEATMMFLDGLLDILMINNLRHTKYRSDFLRVFQYFDGFALQTFDIDNLERAKKLIVQNAVDVINNYNLFIMKPCQSDEKWLSIKIQDNNFANIVVHQWLALFILNKFQMFEKMDKEKLEYIVKTTSKNIPYYMKIFTDNKNMNKCDFSSVDFSNANLSYSDLSESILEYAKLEGVNFKNSILNNTNLSHGKFSSTPKNLASDLSDSSLRNANMSYIDLSNASLQNADLTGVDLSHANLSNVNFTDTTLKNANLSNTSLNRAVIKNTVFDDESSLRCCDFTNAKIMTKQNFSGADLSYSKFENVRLSINILKQLPLDRVDLRGIICKGNLSSFDFCKADLSRANFSKAVLKNTVFSGSNLSSVNFSHAAIDGVKFDNAKFDTTVFSRAVIENVDFSSLSMEYSWMQHTTLKHVNFFQTKLCGAQMSELEIGDDVSWENCNLTGANFQSTNLSKQDLSNTVMSQVNLVEANLNAADLSNTNLTEVRLGGKLNRERNLEILNSDIIVNDKTITKDVQFQCAKYSGRRRTLENLDQTSKIVIGEKFGEIIIRDNPGLSERLILT